MGSIYRQATQALVILIFAILPPSNLVAQFQPDLWQEPSAIRMLDRQHREVLIARHEAISKRHQDAFAQEDSALSLIGLWPWGPCVSIAAGGNNHVFVGNGGLFQVFDMTNPTAPKIVGELFFGGLLVYDMAVSGNFAFIPDGDLKVIDVSDFTKPQIAAKVTIPSDFAHRIIVSGNYAYVGTVRGQLIIVDVSTPASPIVKSTTVLSSEFVMGMAITGQHLFLSTESPIDPIYIYDVSDASNPTLAGYYSVRNSGFATAGQYLYIYTGNNNFQVLDATVPTKPQLVGSVQTPFSGKILVIDNLAYVATRGPLLAIIDVSVPSQPVLRSTALGNPTTTTLVTPTRLALVPPYVVVANEIGFWTFDVSDIDHPVGVAHFATGDASLNIELASNLALICGLKAGLFLVDVSQPQSPRFLANVSPGGSVDDVSVNGNVAFLSGYTLEGDWTPKLWSVDFSQPDKPHVIGDISVVLDHPAGGYPTALAVSDGHAAITYDSGFSVVDIREPQIPRQISSFFTDRIVIDVAISGTFALAASADKGLRVFDISNLGSPQERLAFSGFAAGVTTQNDTAFVALSGGLTILKILPTGILVKIGEVATPGSRSTVDIAVQNEFVYMTYGESVFLIDNADPTRPKIKEHTIAPAFAKGVAVGSNEVFVTGSTWALQIYRKNFETRVEDEKQSHPIQSLQLHQVYPNPLNSFAVIEYEIPTPGWVELKVFSLLGREVVSLVNGFQIAGQHRNVFDASPLSSGVYFCQLKSNGLQKARKMLILK